ncbi:MAG: hypothetical protein QGG34_04655 [SAR202 cluster bacterium]|jgi:hypothetical protein|nr:hypothetical protein [SAR202 cluster bacterium]MDP6302795.1 hypothetical protein [SAR202 cluster bacterium]MDP7103917.1 hypothetical protein [SAR202 cluster bacterium]MDP7225054.1 hypothetical protein [SAR202 cluster bacterium]MDP7412144.1 hypothetical protein [SAR202 cluster bacterium]|tara:strand:+ start:4936 stop:5367 length:432 start_codon:yes stop_codon:yes gene_type:complete
MAAASQKQIANNGGAPIRQILIALLLSIVGTAVIGGVLLLLLDNIWWIAGGSAVSLFGAAMYLGRAMAMPEPLYGTLLAALYVSIAITIILVGTLLAVLPDPFPGLEIGDSTFFFVSPLILLVSGVAGSAIGGKAGGGSQDDS